MINSLSKLVNLLLQRGRPEGGQKFSKIMLHNLRTAPYLLISQLCSAVLKPTLNLSHLYRLLFWLLLLEINLIYISNGVG